MQVVLLFTLIALQGNKEKPKVVPGQAHPKVDQARVDAAIDNGVKFLRTQKKQTENKFVHAWETGAPQQDYSELVLYTMLHAGVPEDDPDFKYYLDKMLGEKLTTTYKVCLQAMILQQLNVEKYQWRIAACAQFIIDNQCENGQWCYGHETNVDDFKPPKEEPKTIGTEGLAKPHPAVKKYGSTETKIKLKPVPVTKKKKGCPAGDHSNSQYAALGLRACLEANVNIPREILVKAKEWWEKHQQGDGGWMYEGNGGPVVPPGQTAGVTYGSMTLGAIGALCIYKHYLKEDFKNDQTVAKGFNWYNTNWSVTENPKYKEWHYYTLYALERAGDLFGTEFVGKHEWYPEGAHWLLDNQQSSGAWKGAGMENDVAATCFAILFLRRATKPLPKIHSGSAR
jgi:hypothetical protein